MFEKLTSMLKRNKLEGSKTMRTILIVDDSELDRKVVISVLARAGYRMIEAVDGKQGLEAARVYKPDLIIVDCEMPVMNGHQMCRALRDESSIEKIPFIFLTAIDTPKNVIDCFDVDAEFFFSKPVDAKLLISRVKSILDGTHVECR
jgi:CheY-like chemotaxis protein